MIVASPSTKVGDNDEQAQFFSDAISWGNVFTLHLGGRYTDYRERQYFTPGVVGLDYDKSKFTPSVAAVVKPAQNISLYASYIEGLERGGVAPLGTVNGNQVMAPILSEQYEAGVKVEFSQLSASLAAFRIERPAQFVHASKRLCAGGWTDP